MNSINFMLILKIYVVVHSLFLTSIKSVMSGELNDYVIELNKMPVTQLQYALDNIEKEIETKYKPEIDAMLIENGLIHNSSYPDRVAVELDLHPANEKIVIFVSTAIKGNASNLNCHRVFEISKNAFYPELVREFIFHISLLKHLVPLSWTDTGFLSNWLSGMEKNELKSEVKLLDRKARDIVSMLSINSVLSVTIIDKDRNNKKCMGSFMTEEIEYSIIPPVLE